MSEDRHRNSGERGGRTGSSRSNGGGQTSGGQGGGGQGRGGQGSGSRGGRSGGDRRPADAAVQPARRVAFDVIEAVRADDAYANLLLPTRIARARLNAADAALATELCYGTLRMQGYYDRVIQIASGRPVDQIDGPVLDVLRLGTHQLLSTRVATHAAVNESVALARLVGSRSATGFTNGVLRRISRTSAEEWQGEVADTAAGADDKRALLSSHPLWVVRALRQALSADGVSSEKIDAELDALLAADNVAPLVNLIAMPGRGDAIHAEADHPNLYSPVGLSIEGGDPHFALKDQEGILRVQDEGSQLVALALSRAVPIRVGERWLDLCAGPGGKSALLAVEAADGGALLVANEVVPVRAELVRKALAPIAGDVPVWELDGREIGEREPAAFDRILLDAPCTGLGALRRRPEARWRKTPRDVSELTVLQAQLLDAAVDALAPSGLLAYVTCSPHLAETRGIVADALRRHGARIRTIDTRSVVESVSRSPIELGSASESVQLWPHRHNTDAMFITIFERYA